MKSAKFILGATTSVALAGCGHTTAPPPTVYAPLLKPNPAFRALHHPPDDGAPELQQQLDRIAADYIRDRCSAWPDESHWTREIIDRSYYWEWRRIPPNGVVGGGGELWIFKYDGQVHNAFHEQ